MADRLDRMELFLGGLGSGVTSAMLKTNDAIHASSRETLIPALSPSEPTEEFLSILRGMNDDIHALREEAGGDDSDEPADGADVDDAPSEAQVEVEKWKTIAALGVPLIMTVGGMIGSLIRGCAG